MSAWPSDLNVIEYPTSAELAVKLADDVADRLTNAIELRGRASLMVSGGSTPVPFFTDLSTRPVDWKHVTVGLVDERWVEPNHKDSNEKLVRDHLLTHAAADAHFVSPYASTQSAVDHLSDYNSMLLALLAEHDGRFDVTVLGMGSDSHTASLFPVTAAVAASDNSSSNPESTAHFFPGAPDEGIAVVTHPQTAPHMRIGLSITGILRSRAVMLHITGDLSLIHI